VLQDFYLNDKNNTSYSGGFLYFRNGTYTPYASEDGQYYVLISNYKPLVWMAYPGESPIIDESIATIYMRANGSNTYFDGLTLKNISNPMRQGIRIDSGANNVTLINNNCSGITEKNGTNMACIFIESANKGQFWTIQNNSFHDNTRSMGIEGYVTGKVLIEDNSFYNLYNGGGASNGIMPKVSCSYWTIRHNTFNNVEGYAIGLDGYTLFGPFGNNEINFNYVYNVPARAYALRAGWDDGGMGTHFIYRNTFAGLISFSSSTVGPGPFILSNNVLQTNSPQISGTLTYAIDSNNLKGVAGMIDTNGNLTPAYSKYVGLNGWQIKQNLRVIYYSSDDPLPGN